MKIKKYYKPGVALTLAFVLVVPSLPFGIKPMKVKAELQTSAMGNFAQWYGQEYQRKQAEKNNNNNSDSGANKDFGMPSLPKKGTYEATVTNDIAKGIETYSINAFADWSKKEIANYLTKGDKKEINKLWGQLTKQYHESTVMKKAPYKKINKTANKINMKSSKVSKITKRVGTGVNVVMAGKGLYDMYNQPNVGYKSPFLEFCANSVRGMSAVSNVILPEGSWAYGVVEGVVTSETLVKYVNDKNFKAGPLDDWVDTFNKYYQNKFEQWFFGDQLKTVEENEKRIQLAKQYCQGASCNANGVNVYKPNIYLYPEKDTEVTVTFDMPQLLTVTDPVYDNCWKVMASPDGKLVDITKDTRSGMNEYQYLFYESLTMPTGWQKEEGFIISSQGREERFADILASYGLNEQEIADFNEFWTDKLDADKEYYMYPQLTETIDLRMPVDIKPAPDSILRIWFAFDENDKPTNEPKVNKFARDGFSAVEWGGFVLK